MSHLKRCRLDAHHAKRKIPLRGAVMIVDILKLILDKILNPRTIYVASVAWRDFFLRWRDALEESGWET